MNDLWIPPVHRNGEHSFPHNEHLALGAPSAFSGKPGEAPAPFLYRVQINVLHFRTRFSEDRDQIVYLSSFLEGAALDWFLGLLRRNAVLVVAHENGKRAEQRAKRAKEAVDERARLKRLEERARRRGSCEYFGTADSTDEGEREPDLKLDEHLPARWAQCPFVLPELKTFEAFAEALTAAFSDHEPETLSRSHTPTESEATLTWD